MPGVRVKENEPLERALRRFNHIVEQKGILSELKKKSTLREPKRKEKKEAKSD